MKSLLAVLLFVAMASTTLGATHTVRMTGNRFSPANLTVQPGDTVTWINDDFAGHDTVSGTGGVPSGTWRSPLFGRGGTFSFTFDLPFGNYPYYCTPHVGIGMVGSITVAPPPNTPPTIQITSPTANSTFFAPATFFIEATATDTDGIARVQFLRGNVSLGTVTAAPYRLEVTIPQTGRHSLRAIATDTRGASATNLIFINVNTQPNTPPSISITSPADNSRFIAPATFDLVAQPVDAEGIASVEFFLDGASLGSTNSVPYSFPISIPVPGTYNLSAAVTDNAGIRATNSITVLVDDPPAGTLLVSILSPTNGQEFIFPAPVPIQAFATNELTRVTEVQFFVDGVQIASDIQLPFETSAPGLVVGEHIITAVAMDARSQVVSNTVRIVVIEPPNLNPSITLSVVESGPYQAGQVVRINATFSDPDGAITNVVFLANHDEQVSRPGLSSPQVFFAALEEGMNLFWGIATDNRGQSETNLITLTAHAPPPQFDILFRHDSGLSAIWRIEGGNIIDQRLLNDGQPIHSSWRIIDSGDLDKDGHAEILLQYEDGSLAIWRVRDSALAGFDMLNALPPFGRAWRAVGLGDVNGDANLDIIWRHDLGYIAAYLLSGTTFLSGDLVSETPVPHSWQLATISDVNFDRADDLVWRLPDGTRKAWVLRDGKLSYLSDAVIPSTSIESSFTGVDGAKYYAGIAGGILEFYTPTGVTRYPSTPISQGWRVIGISPGQVSSNTPAIQFVSPGSMVEAGNVQLIARSPISRAKINSMRFWVEGSGQTNYVGVAETDGTNFFTTINLRPGSYVARAVAQNPGAQPASAFIAFTVSEVPSISVQAQLQEARALIDIRNVLPGIAYELLESNDLRNWNRAGRSFQATGTNHQIQLPADSTRNAFYRIRKL